MCDYCGCRGRRLLARLGEDHVAFARMAAAITRAVDRDDQAGAREAAADLAATLAAHSRLEEEGLYPALVDEGVPMHDMVDEHQAVDAVIAAFAAGGADAAEVAAALRRLDAHITREEYDLFPAAHQLLGDLVWDRIDAGGSPP